MEKYLNITKPLYNKVLGITNDFLYPSNSTIYGKVPRYNEPLYHEVLGITNDFLYPSNSTIYGKVPRYNEQILTVPWHFVISRFYHIVLYGKLSE